MSYTRNSKKRGGKLRLVLPDNPPKPDPVLAKEEKPIPSQVIWGGEHRVRVAPGVYRLWDIDMVHFPEG